jgi:hypothetical protein
MPVQPLADPRWATDETNNDEPLSGKKNTGFPQDSDVISTDFNWLFFTLYGWQQLAKARLPRDVNVHLNWCAPSLGACTIWDSGTGVTTVEKSAHASRPGPWLRHNVAANNDRATRGTTDRFFVGPLPAGVRITMEWLVEATDLAGTPALSYKAGLFHDESQDVFTEDALVFYKSSASANWRLVSSSGTAENEDTGIAASGVQRLRLEFYGSGWSGGQRLEAWIDDTLVATADTQFPANDAMTFGAFLKSTGAANKNVYTSAMSLVADLQAP